ncbi:hypothetical protein HD806DRAFT_501249 [Xylariaceae sp. AK1471]|nr:hypothetical protein HD806DRAFT_501249 [Xylariaceae sp. AK1471]
MASTQATPAETPAMSDIGHLIGDEIIQCRDVADDNDDDDQEEGGTLLAVCDSFWAAPFGDETATGSQKQNGDKPKTPAGDISTPPSRNHRTVSKHVLDTNRILDWLLGRHAIEDSTNEPGPPKWDHKHDINEDDDFLDIGDVQDICPACTTPYCQAVDSIPFKSSLKLIYNDPSSQKWLVGNRYILHEAVDDHPEDEYVPIVETSRALKILAPSVPVPKVRAGWKENGKIVTISDTVPGERLYGIWWDLSDAEREHIAKQVAQYIDQWRESDLGRISNLAGGPVYHHENLFGTQEEGGFGPFSSDLDLWHAIERRLRNPDRRIAVDEDTIQLLRDHAPPSSPCVFTHGDLSSRNIIVHNREEVAAITGFEHAASLPVWTEDVAMHFCYCREDEKWKALLSKHTRARSRGYQAALDWWSLWTAVEDGKDDGMDPVRLESLKDRCRRWKKTEIRGDRFSSGSGRLGLGVRQAASSNKAESHARNLIHQAIKPDVLFWGRNYRHQDSMSDGSWGRSTDDELEEEQERDSEEDDQGESNAARKQMDSTAFHQMQQQLSTLTTGPYPRQVLEALSREHIGRKPPPKPLPLGSLARSARAVAFRDSSSDADSESGLESVAAGPPHHRSRSKDNKPQQSSDNPRPQHKGLRPLSLPAYALSESARSKLRSAVDEEAEGEGDAAGGSREETIAKALRSLSSIQEDDASNSAKEGSASAEAGKDAVGTGSKAQTEGQQRKRTSMFKNRVAPGSLYAALSEARPRQQRQHARSRSEERTRLAKNGQEQDVSRGAGSRPRPQSVLQPPTPSFHHDVSGIRNGEGNSAKDGNYR